MSRLVAPLLAVTIPDASVFAVSALAILAGAIGVVRSRNPVHAALMLVMTLCGVAILFVEQQAQFLAAVQVIVYAGAIVVLFLFVIMLLGVDREENIRAEPLRGQRPLAIVLGLLGLAEVLALVHVRTWTTGASSVAGTARPGSNVAVLGRSLFTTYLLAFEVTSVLLVISVVGAVLLARRAPKQRPKQGEEPDSVGADTLIPFDSTDPDEVAQVPSSAGRGVSEPTDTERGKDDLENQANSEQKSAGLTSGGEKR